MIGTINHHALVFHRLTDTKGLENILFNDALDEKADISLA